MKRCELCARAKMVRLRSARFYNPMLAMEPWQVVHVDVMKISPRSAEGHVGVLTVVDKLTGFTRWIPLKDLTALSIARVWYEEILLREGFVPIVVSDNGSEFLGVFKALLRAQGIDHRFTASRNPAANGAAERSHRVLRQHLRMRAAAGVDMSDWHLIIRELEFAHNAAARPHLGGISAFEAAKGRSPMLPEDTPFHRSFVISAADVSGAARPWLQAIRKRFKASTQRVALDKEARQLASLRRANSSKHIPQFKVGDEVFHFVRRVTKDQAGSSATRWHGPYRIVKVLTGDEAWAPSSYMGRHIKTGKPFARGKSARAADLRMAAKFVSDMPLRQRPDGAAELPAPVLDVAAFPAVEVNDLVAFRDGGVSRRARAREWGLATVLEIQPDVGTVRLQPWGAPCSASLGAATWKPAWFVQNWAEQGFVRPPDEVYLNSAEVAARRRAGWRLVPADFQAAERPFTVADVVVGALEVDDRGCLTAASLRRVRHAKLQNSRRRGPDMLPPVVFEGGQYVKVASVDVQDPVGVWRPASILRHRQLLNAVIEYESARDFPTLSRSPEGVGETYSWSCPDRNNPSSVALRDSAGARIPVRNVRLAAPLPL